MSKLSQERGLLLLEKQRRSQVAPPPSAIEILFAEKLYELLGTMNPKHAQPVAKELDANGVEGCSDFTMEVLRTVIYHVDEGRPLAFPDAVAEAYLHGKKVPGRAICMDCRYWLPAGHFTLCPLCNGNVGF